MASNKKEAIMAIAKILFEKTNIDHPMTQREMLDELLKEYEINLERKAVGNSYQRLSDMGFQIEDTGKGVYLDREHSKYLGCGFSDAELRLLIDAIRCNRYLSVPHSQKLIKKLELLTDEHFAHYWKNVSFLGDWDKSDNVGVFERVQTLSKAIQEQQQVLIQYGKYGIDKKLHQTSEVCWSPYLLLWHNQRYYLMAHNDRHEGVTFLRVDQMMKVEIVSAPSAPIREIKGFKNGIDKPFLKDLATARPYMFSDPATTIRFTIPKSHISDVIDWFGKDITLTDVKQSEVPYVIKNYKGEPEELVRVRLQSSENAMKYWALQYLDFVTIEYPTSLKVKIQESLTNGKDRYC